VARQDGTRDVRRTCRVPALEEDLGVPLYTRGARRTTLTAAGHRVLEFAMHTQQRADLRSQPDADRTLFAGMSSSPRSRVL
jgi:DNA-binding transcriptional LysR family regulator